MNGDIKKVPFEQICHSCHLLVSLKNIPVYPQQSYCSTFFRLCLHQVLRDGLCSACALVFRPLSLLSHWYRICTANLLSFFSNLWLCLSMIFPAAPRPARVAWQWQLEWYVLYSAVICIIGTVKGSVQCQCFWCRSDKTVVSCWRLTDKCGFT